MKFLEMFNPVEKGNFALTDEVIYNSIQNNDELIPLYGGNKSHKKASRYVSASTVTKKGQEITIFNGEGIIISLDGSSGSMTYKNGERFALNHHAGFITAKGEGIVRLEFFALFFQNFLRNLSVSNGSKTLSLVQLYSADFDLPDYDLQCRVLDKILSINKQMELLNLIQDKYTELFKKQIVAFYTNYQAKDVPISKAISCMSGNSGLTGEFVYNNLINGIPKYKVLSGATQEENYLGMLPECELNGKKINVFKDKCGLLVIRKGKAGCTKFLPVDNYTINDDAYILYVNEDCDYNIDLRWFEIQYKNEIQQYSSSSDNGTWNKTGFFSNTLIDIPDINEQLRIVAIYDKLQHRAKKIAIIKKEYEKIFSKEVV